MILRQETIRAVVPACAKEDQSQRTNKIQITPAGEVVATDGHILLVAKDHTRFPDEDFPAEGVPAYHGDPLAAITVTRPLVDQLLARVPKPNQKPARTIPILAAVQLGTNGDGSTYLAATDLSVPTVIKILPSDQQAGGFPTWERVLPAANKPAIKIGISADVLAALVKAAKTVNPGHEHGGMITFSIPTEPQYQGLDREAAIEAGGCYEKSDKYGKTLIDPKTERPAAERDYPNGCIQSPVRVEIDGRDVGIVGAVAPMLVRK